MKVVVVDYGMGNLHPVLKSVQTAQSLSSKTAEIYLTDRPENVSATDKIVFPGQGAIPDCIATLRKGGLGEAVADGLENKPFFGICVGAQLSFEHSEESNTAGLGRFEGHAKRFLPNQTNVQDNRLEVPHMGRNAVRQTRPYPLFKDIAPNSRFYFVHNYYLAPEDPDVILGTSEYPHEFAYIAGKNNIFVTQLRTEKSHDAGLLLLRNFLDWNGD